MKAIIFPGQGSQYSQMAKKLYDKYDIAKEFYDKAKKIVGSSIVEIGFEADEETLKLTQNAQISIFLYSYILFCCLVNNGITFFSSSFVSFSNASFKDLYSISFSTKFSGKSIILSSKKFSSLSSFSDISNI